MKNATLRLGLWAAALAFLATPAWAQETSDVTFRVDMTAAIENCVLPEDGIVTVRGTFNNWGNDGQNTLRLSPGDNNVYAGTFEVPNGDINYKFWGSPPVDWEGGSDRTATITGDTTLAVVPFNREFEDECEVVREEYQVVFEVDMSIQELTGAFRPGVDRVFVAGEAFGWEGSQANNELFPRPANPSIYSGVLVATVAVPSTQPYKFTILREGTTDADYESGANRTFVITGNEEDSDDDGRPEAFVDRRYFGDVGPEDILEEEATVRFEVDLRTAYYYLADNDLLPSDTQTGEPVTSIDGLFVNGPIAGASSADTASDWAGWGPEALGLIETRRLLVNGTHAEVAGTDSVFTITYTYPAGTARTLTGKFGINGYDNEGGFGADHYFTLTPGEQTFRIVYGCIRQQDGTYTATNGPSFGEGESAQDFSTAYSPYVEIVNQGEASTCAVVRQGGTVGVEPVGRAPEGLVLKGSYPNPAVSATTFEYGLPEAGHVRLEVFDLMGRRVATVVDEVQAASTYRVRFDVDSLVPGTYFFRLSAGESVATQRMTVIR